MQISTSLSDLGGERATGYSVVADAPAVVFGIGGFLFREVGAVLTPKNRASAIHRQARPLARVVKVPRFGTHMVP